MTTLRADREVGGNYDFFVREQSKKQQSRQ
jgi:hypothetical protein